MTTYQFHEISYSFKWKSLYIIQFKSFYSVSVQTIPIQVFRSSSLSEIHQISMLQSKRCIKQKVTEISKWNFNIQTPENVQHEFQVVLHFHHQQPAISPANSVLSLKFLSIHTMSQSSSASSSIYSITALSADNSVEDVGLFMQLDQSGNQMILPIILLPRKQPEILDFEGEDLIRIEEAILQQADSGHLRVPTQQEARRLRQERVQWVQQVQLEPRSCWSLERGEVIQLESIGTRGRRIQEGLQDSERVGWTLVIWLGWIFGIIRDWWRN